MEKWGRDWDCQTFVSSTIALQRFQDCRQCFLILVSNSNFSPPGNGQRQPCNLFRFVTIELSNRISLQILQESLFPDRFDRLREIEENDWQGKWREQPTGSRFFIYSFLDLWHCRASRDSPRHMRFECKSLLSWLLDGRRWTWESHSGSIIRSVEHRSRMRERLLTALLQQMDRR
jgi:hypothetical protein